MSCDMTTDVFALTSYGKAALTKMGIVPKNFRLYKCWWLDATRSAMGVIGAEFRVAKSGKNVGKLSILIPRTEIRVVVTIEEMQGN